MLRRLVPPLLYVDHVERRVVDLFNTACEQYLEGIVAKLANRPVMSPNRPPATSRM